MSLVNLNRYGSKASDRVRVSLSEKDALTLPPRTRQIRVISGQAWISLGHEDVVIGPQETLYLHQKRPGAVVTSLGKQRLEFDLIEE